MKSYKDSSFEGRAGQAADAKQKALAQLRAKPPLSDEQLAARRASSDGRETAKATKSSAKQAAKDAAIAASAAEASVPAPPTEAERKAARDARYAARKNRK